MAKRKVEPIRVHDILGSWSWYWDGPGFEAAPSRPYTTKRGAFNSAYRFGALLTDPPEIVVEGEADDT